MMRERETKTRRKEKKIKKKARRVKFVSSFLL